MRRSLFAFVCFFLFAVSLCSCDTAQGSPASDSEIATAAGSPSPDKFRQPISVSSFPVDSPAPSIAVPSPDSNYAALDNLTDSAAKPVAENKPMTDDEKYQSAKEEFDYFVSSRPGAIGGSVLNFDYSPHGHPYLNATINYHSDFDSVYNFQFLVCDTLNEVQRIEEKYLVQFDNLSVYFRFDDPAYSDAFVEYSPTHMDDIFVGTITDEYNHVSGYKISADQIASWFSGQDYSNAVSDVNAPCTFDEYLHIENGMSYEDVSSLIGSAGIELSSVSYSGVTTSMFQWNGSKKYSVVIVEFSNNEVIAKSQSGLE